MEEGDSMMEMNTSGRLMSRLIGEAEQGDMEAAFKRVPPEIGVCRVQQRISRQGTACIDWEMFYRDTVCVERRRNQPTGLFQAIFFLNRELVWEAGDHGKTIYVEKGEVCLYHDNELISAARYPSGCQFHFKNVQLPIQSFNRIVAQHFDEKEQRQLKQLFEKMVKLPITVQMMRILNEIERVDLYRGGLASLYLESKVLELLFACLSAGMEKEEADFGRTGNAVSRSDRETVLAIRRRIDLDCVNIADCSQLAKEAGISMSKLKRGFRDSTGMPLHSYVIERRLEQAAWLLSSNRMNVSQAAMQSGYSNMSHFSAAFRKKYGVSPREFCQ